MTGTLLIVIVSAVHPLTSAVLAVVGDGRSGDPLHERGDKRDVYEGEVAKVDFVSELVRRVDGVVDGLRSLVDVARGSVGGVCGDVFEEVEERFAHPSVRVHHERDEFLMHRRSRSLVRRYLLFFSVSRFMMGSPLGAELPWRGRGWLVWLTAESMMWVMETSARIVMPVSRRPLTRMSGRRLLVLPSLFVVPGISPMGSVNVVKPPCLQIG